MQIQINGNYRVIAARTVAELVKELGYENEGVVVELNESIIPQEKWSQTPLAENDALELLSFVGGG